MARVTQDGEIFSTELPGDILIGRIEKRKEQGDFLATCSRDTVSFVGRKSEVVANIEGHFVRDHTTTTG